MSSEKALQKILFVCLGISFVASLRLLERTKVGAFLIALILVGLFGWAGLRLISGISRLLWAWAGRLTRIFVASNEAITEDSLNKVVTKNDDKVADVVGVQE